METINLLFYEKKKYIFFNLGGKLTTRERDGTLTPYKVLQVMKSQDFRCIIRKKTESENVRIFHL